MQVIKDDCDTSPAEVDILKLSLSVCYVVVTPMLLSGQCFTPILLITVFFSLLLPSSSWNYIDNTTELEYQLALNSSYFRTNRAGATSELYNWMDLHLEQMKPPGVPYVEVDLNDILPYSRNSTRFCLNPGEKWILRHRYGIAGNRTRNEVIWKITDYRGGVTPEYMAAASQWDYHYKVEYDLTCSSNTTAISSYARMDMNHTVVIITAGDANRYFPNFTDYYGVDPSHVLSSMTYTQYVKDCDVKIAGNKAEFTTVLNYDNYDDYLNDYLPPTSTRTPEDSIKVDKEDTVDWETAMLDAKKVFDYLLFYCPYMVQENCTEINSLEDLDEDGNGKHQLGANGIILVVALVTVISVLVGITYGYYRKRSKKGETLMDSQHMQDSGNFRSSEVQLP